MNKFKNTIHLSNIKDLDELIKTATRESDCVNFSQLQDYLNFLDPEVRTEVIKDTNIIADTLCAADVPRESIQLIETALKDIFSTIASKEIKPLEYNESNI